MAAQHLYEQIEANKRNTWILILLCFGLFLGCGYTFGSYYGSELIGLILAFLIALLISATAYFQGKSLILFASSAKKIAKADHPQLFNVVEEMSIAAGIPVPEIYIIEDTAPNAFATGNSPKEAAVAITRGLLEKLNRDELQGVIAHEISHIRNFDTRFAMLMAILVGSIVLMSDLFWRMLRGSSSNRRSSRSSGQAQLIILLIAIVLAILAPVLAKILQLAISRQREYLADGSAAELTRYPQGLASALEKIAADQEPLEVANRATQHLYIVSPNKAVDPNFDSVWSTHPPINKRIERLRELAHQYGEVKSEK
jgi:heat shock protein HtpX